MPSTYNPSSIAPPTGYTIPSDGDAPIKVSDVNVPFEGLMDAVKYLYTGRLTLKTFAFLGSDGPGTPATYSSTSYTAGPTMTGTTVAINDIVIFGANGQAFISTGPDTGFMRLTYRYGAGSCNQLLGNVATVQDATNYHNF